MRKLFFAVTFMIMCLGAMSQNITLTFTGRDGNNRFIPLNRVEITNVTQNWSETIYYPDTILMLGSTGIDEFGSEKEFALSQNVPNPFDGTTDFLLNMPHNGRVLLEVYDLNGKKITEYKNSLPSGTHTFKVILSTSQSYMLTARSGANRASIKMVNNGHAGENAIRYLGAGHMLPLTMQMKGGVKGQTDKPFAIGDQMKYVGYALINGEECKSSTIEHSLLGSETITLIFDIASSEDDGKPCKGLATITDVDGNIYNTVKIGEQCWMKENLRTTKYADGSVIEHGSVISNEVPYWYYPDDNSSNKARYGLLYNWKAVIRNSSSSNANPSCVQGVCPTGWHVPSEAEWTQLTDYVSSQNKYICGSDYANIAKALASTIGWKNSTEVCTPGNDQSSNNATGFSALPAGEYTADIYYRFGDEVNIWSATSAGYNAAAHFSLHYELGAGMGAAVAYAGFSVRCLRGDGIDVTTLTISDISTTSATCGGDIISDGGAEITARGVCWSTTHYPTINDDKTVDGTGTGSFISNMTELIAGTTYYIRAYATISIGTVYGEERIFTTLQLPSLTTTKVYGITSNAAISGGDITSDGGAQVTARGVCWSTEHNPTINDNKTTDGMGMGSFISNMTELIAGTTYYVRAYATNCIGTAYGGEKSFITAQDGRPCPGAVTLTDCDSNTYNTVQIGEQCWMRENLRVTRFTDGASIFKGADNVAAWHFTSSADLSATNGIEANRGVAKVSNSMGSALNYIGSSYCICCSGWNKVVEMEKYWLIGPISFNGINSDMSIKYNVQSSSTGPQTFFFELKVGKDGDWLRLGRYNLISTTLTTIGFELPYQMLANQREVYFRLLVSDKSMAVNGGEIAKNGTNSLAEIVFEGKGDFYFYPNNDIANVTNHGLLYNWSAVMHNSSSSSSNPSGVQGVCPTGWHVPSDAEWTELTDYVSSRSLYQCNSISNNIAKALASTTDWNTSSTTCAVGNTQSNNNATGFSAVPTGGYLGDYHHFGHNAYFWSATEYGSDITYYRGLYYDRAYVNRYNDYKDYGFSVRCVKDE